MFSNHGLLKALPLATFLFVSAQSPMTAAVILAVDFQQTGASTNQTGFSQFAGNASQLGLTTKTFSTANGNVSVGVDPGSLSSCCGYFDRGGLVNSGAFTYADLYNSFVFGNSPNGFAPNQTTSLTLTLSGPGINANAVYLLNFYSFDNRPQSGQHTVTFTGISGTTGTSTLASNFALPPTSNNQYSVAQTYQSDNTGTLTFQVTDFYGFISDARSGVRLNAFILSDAPEPATSATLLIGFGMLALWARRRH